MIGPGESTASCCIVRYVADRHRPVVKMDVYIYRSCSDGLVSKRRCCANMRSRVPLLITHIKGWVASIRDVNDWRLADRILKPLACFKCR